MRRLPESPGPPLERTGAAAPGSGPLRIAVVGAGVSGVAALRALAGAGFDVTVFDRVDDLGGVWSASRAYPGIETQDDARTYGYSDGPIPNDRNGHAPGAEVRAYLERLLDRDGLLDRVRLRTEVRDAELVDDAVWTLRLEGPDGASTERFDWLVAANGVFSVPHVPDWSGSAEFRRSGGRILTPVELGSGADLEGADVVVVGWGKTACDLAVVAARHGARVHVVARTLSWKYPRRFGAAGLSFRHLVLTRGGERALFTRYRGSDDRLLLRRIPERLPRLLLDRLLARSVDKALGLTGLGLRPVLEARTSSSLVTEGFFEAVHDGRITVHRECGVASLDGGPGAALTDGTRIPASVVVAATGYEQGLPFLGAEVRGRFGRAASTIRLRRGVLALDVPRLALIGWAHNYRSPLTAEVSSAWLAGVLSGAVPSRSRRRLEREALHAPLSVAAPTTAGAHLLPQMRFADLDRMLADLGRALPLRVRIRQVWRPLDPSDYRAVHRARRRHPASPR